MFTSSMFFIKLLYPQLSHGAVVHHSKEKRYRDADTAVLGKRTARCIQRSGGVTDQRCNTERKLEIESETTKENVSVTKQKPNNVFNKKDTLAPEKRTIVTNQICVSVTEQERVLVSGNYTDCVAAVTSRLEGASITDVTCQKDYDSPSSPIVEAAIGDNNKTTVPDNSSCVRLLNLDSEFKIS